MPNTPTHLVVGDRDRVLDTVYAPQGLTPGEAGAIREAHLFGQRNVRVLDVAGLDVATLASIAATDYPKMAAKGSGPFGAGTHPAQPYLEVMLQMSGVGVEYNVRDVRFPPGEDADGILIRFLGNVSAWRGDTARAVKARLKSIAAG